MEIRKVKMHAMATDMCCTVNGEKQVFVASHGNLGLHAYDMETGAVLWKTGGTLSGMDENLYASGHTTDEKGHIFVCDANND